MPTSPGPLLQVLTALWEHIRANHPELPGTQIVVTPAPPRGDHGPERWLWVGDDTVTGLVVSADTLSAGPAETLRFMRHEAAHLLSWIRGIQDTTMHGGYHNQRFIVAAEEVGLTWPEGQQRASSRGYADVELKDETLALHTEDLEALERAIPQTLPHLTIQSPSTERRKVSRLLLHCRCTPVRKIMVSRTVAEVGPITCGVCGAPFSA